MNPEMKSAIIAEIISWSKTIIFAVIFAICINKFIIVNASVPTGSMEDNIMPGDRIVAFRLSYLFKTISRFDVVVFHYPDDESFLYVKRVIGLPGETVTIIDGKIYIDDSSEALDDSYVKDVPLGNFGPYTVPEGQYFMMGDNRNFSQDSRYWKNTFVEKNKILGKVMFKYYKGVKIIN